MSYNYLSKIIVVGDSGVGKTSLTKTLSGRMFQNQYTPTIGVDFVCKESGNYELSNRAFRSNDRRRVEAIGAKRVIGSSPRKSVS